MPSQFTVPAPGVSLTNATPVNVISQTLTAGAFLCWGQLNFALTGATITAVQAGVSLVSAAYTAQPGDGQMGPDSNYTMPIIASLLTSLISIQTGPTILRLTAPAVCYLVAQATFTLGTVTCYGTVSALQLIGSNYNLIVS